jgi:BirA family transcriptional regulator, biotin operon repressor / biotin---[acetyl-CoA-carboxylase] ligase
MWNIHLYEEIASTQTLARQMLEAGSARHGDVYQALHQTSGRGRYGTRSWVDEPGENLLVSVVLTSVAPHLAPQMQFLTGLAVLRTIRSLLTIQGTDENDIQLKWTNDILVGKRKIAGILCDSVWSGSELRGIIAGVGINVNQMFFDPSLRTPATSLRMETNIFFPLDEVQSRLLDELDNALLRYSASDMLMSDLRKELEWMKQLERFEVIAPDGSAESGLKYLGITDEGALWTVNEQGDVRAFDNATLRL